MATLTRQVIEIFPRASLLSGRYCSKHSTVFRSLGTAIKAPNEVKIVEVGPRDGLQNEPTILSVEDKVELVKKLADSGCKNIEAGAFVSKKMVPAMANSYEVMKELQLWKDSRTVISCLVPTINALEKAVDVGADEVAIFGSASESFSQKNINCSIAESVERFREVTEESRRRGIPVRGYVSCVIACPYEGRVKPSEVARVTEALLELGCYEISLGDTIGVGTPASTIEMLDVLIDSFGEKCLAVHFHDTYGQGLANILVSLERGISTVDSSVAGLGGCPYAKGASGNVATEDVVYMLNGLGVETCIDLDKLVDAGEYICGVLGTQTRSRAGLAIAAKRNTNTV